MKIYLGRALLGRNRLSEAEKSELDAYETIKQTLGEQSPLQKQAATTLIEIYEKEGKHDSAEN
ncbi:MAG: hypothetical protein ABJB09_06055 [Verrucomicrobiota bacterium]